MKMIGLARLGRDAETRFTQGGDAITNIAIAFNYGKKENGQQPTQWIDASLWGKRGESLAPYLTKGTHVCVTLSDVHVRTYQTKDGETKSALSAKVDDIEFAGSRQNEQHQEQPASKQPQQSRKSNHAGFENMDDDVPF